MNRINAYDSFEIVSSKQVFENIRIEINFPFYIIDNFYYFNYLNETKS